MVEISTWISCEAILSIQVFTNSKLYRKMKKNMMNPSNLKLDNKNSTEVIERA